MEVAIQIDAGRKEPKAVIYASEITEEVNEAVKKLSGQAAPFLPGIAVLGPAKMESTNEIVQLLEPSQIYHIYAANQKIFAVTAHGEFRLKMRLYELEEQLKENMFVRISNSELVNLRQAEQFDLSLSGTICVKLKNREKVYVSRRYVKKIKSVLGM